MWQQHTIIKDGKPITRVSRVSVTKQYNGECMVTWVSDHDKQLHCGYLRLDGSFVYMGTPFPNQGKEADGAAFLTWHEARAVAAVQVGGAGIENELQYADLWVPWARP